MAQILNGRAISGRIRDKVKIMVNQSPIKPGMAAILVGEDPASHLYVSLKENASKEAGIHFEKILFPSETAPAILIEQIHSLNARADIHGILVQLPLPNHQNPDAVIAAIDPNKDIDGFHPESLRRLEMGEPGLVSPVALGVMKILEESHEHPSRAIIISSPIFARPLVALLKERGIESEVVDATDPELMHKTKIADLLIVAAGRPQLVKEAMIRPGAIVIDVGTTKVNERLVGDVDYESASRVAGAITPVPGGVGPVTVSMLLLNVLKAVGLNRRQQTPQ